MNPLNAAARCGLVCRYPKKGMSVLSPYCTGPSLSSVGSRYPVLARNSGRPWNVGIMPSKLYVIPAPRPGTLVAMEKGVPTY